MTQNQDEHGGMKGVVEKMQDMVGGMVGMASASTAGAHAAPAFVASATVGDLYEIGAGSLALERSGSPEVRTFARMMVDHHTTSAHQLQSALRSTEVRTESGPPTAPETLDEHRRGMIDNLRDAPDDAFDGRYLDQQKMAHQETLALLKGYAEHGDNPQLQSYARGGIPMVERHLKMLGAIRA
jgi:putative membrane protein